MGIRPAATASLFGTGTATVGFVRQSSLPAWSYDSALYQFEPVPEPGTLFLVATTLAGLAVRRRQASERYI